MLNIKLRAANLRDDDSRGRLCYIIEAALEYFINLIVTGAYLARITSSLGFSDSLTGILSSFVSLGCLFQLGAIRLFRNVRRPKRPILAMHMVNQTLFGLSYFIPVAPWSAGLKAVLFMVCFCAATVIANLLMPTKTNWLMLSVPDRTRGVFTANKEIVSLLGGMTFTYLTGTMIDTLESAGARDTAFILGGVIIFVLMLLHTLSLVPVREHEQPVGADRARVDVKGLLRNRMFVRVIVVVVLWNVANYAATPFYGAYQIKELGFSMTFISVLSIAYSVVRMLFSPLMGKYADRHSFSHMVLVCFSIAAVSFLVNCFTVPENGRVCYTIYYCLSAIAWAGISSSLINLIYDYVRSDDRSSAMAISNALGGVAGFVSTCLMSPMVSLIQAGGNTLLGMTIYPSQFVSAVAFVLTALLAVYVYLFVVRAGKQS